MKSVGINRLSIGLQATQEKHLNYIGRIHTYEQFEQNYKEARNIGFNNINIDLPPGYIMGLIGPNGSGKTTLLKCIMALYQPDEGRICIDGKYFPGNEKQIKDNIESNNTSLKDLKPFNGAPLNSRNDGIISVHG